MNTLGADRVLAAGDLLALDVRTPYALRALEDAALLATFVFV